MSTDHTISMKDAALAFTLRKTVSDRVAAELEYRPTAAELAEDEVWTPLGLKRDPEDPAVFPAKRPGYGVGVTVNLATPAGRWLVRGFVAVFIVGLPLAIWLGAYAAR